MASTMSTKKLRALSGTQGADDPHGLVEAERCARALSSELSESGALDAELPSDVFDLTRRRPAVPRDVPRVDTGDVHVIHNTFWVAGKVPSLNDLIDAKGTRAPIIRSIIMRQKPKKGQRGGGFDLYNDIKQDWTQRTIRAVGSPFVRVTSAYFGYVVVEERKNRDPSNVVSAAIKFIEDGLIKAGVIPNDGWGNVLGIRPVCIHRPGREPGVYVVMSDRRIDEDDLVLHYEESFLSQ